jgi:hypothetical protein
MQHGFRVHRLLRERSYSDHISGSTVLESPSALFEEAITVQFGPN